MKFRNLGRTGVQVSQLCLAQCLSAAMPTQAKPQMYRRPVNAGPLSTANSYNKGESEKMVGSLMAGHRGGRAGNQNFENGG